MRKLLLSGLCLALLAVACDRTSAPAARPNPLAPDPPPTSSGSAVVPGALSHVLCAATLLESVKLDHDLTCTGNGLIVGADGITIDLNGHAITGAGSGIGIAVTGRNDIRITGGTIRNFAVAVRTLMSTGVLIDHNEFDGNPEGIDLQAGSNKNTIKDNAFRNSATRAIMLRGDTSANDIKANTFSGNRVGILLFGATFSTLKDNIISGSAVAGIRINVIATGNVLKDNTVTSNLAGIEFLVTTTGSAVGNELKGNTILTNTCGLKGPTASNSLKDNSFQGNVADMCS